MTKAIAARFSLALLVPVTFLAVSLSAGGSKSARSTLQPITIPPSNELSDTLTENDIPTGEGGFARDYTLNLSGGDQVAIDLISENFDTIVTLLASDGSTCCGK
jgi:hypothetical protein